MLLALALSLAIDRPVSPVELGTASSGQWSARAVASDGRDFLAVWNDDRLESPGLHAAVMRDDGPTPSLALGTLPIGDAAAVWNGESYVVAWLEADFFSPTFTRVARLDRDGALLGVTEGLLGVKATPPASVAMAVNRGVTVVAWLSDANVVVQRLGRDGRVVAESAISVRECQRVGLVAAGDGFILLAQRGLTLPGGGVVAWRLDGNGVPLGDMVPITDDTPTAGAYGAATFGPQLIVNTITAPAFRHPAMLRTRIVDVDLRGGRDLAAVQVPSGYAHAAITCDAGCTTIISGYGRGGPAVGSVAASLDPLRGVLGPFEELLSGFADAPRMAWNGQRYLVLWSTTRALRAMPCDAFLHAAGVWRDVVVEPRRQSHVAAAARGHVALLAWIEGFGDANVDLMTASFDGERMSTPLPLARDIRNIATAPAVAATDFGYVVVWMNGVALQSMRVSESGAPLDPAPRVLAGGPFYHVGVAVAGATVLVVWSDTNHVYGERLGLDAAPFVIADGQNAAVASNGSEFLVTWTENSYGEAQRIATSGKFVEEPTSAVAANGFPVVAASDGRDYLLALSGGTSIRVAPLLGGEYVLPEHSLGVIAPGCGLAGAPGRYLLATTTSFWMYGPSAIFEIDAFGAIRSKTTTSWRNVDSAAIVPLDGGARFLVASSRADDADPRGVPRRVLWRIVN